jgi:hypothetical protein
MKQHYTTPPTTLTQVRVSDHVSVQPDCARHDQLQSGQTSQLTPVSGYYFQTDKDGKLTKEQVPFVAPNILLTQKMLDELLPSDRIEAGTNYSQTRC